MQNTDIAIIDYNSDSTSKTIYSIKIKFPFYRLRFELTQKNYHLNFNDLTKIYKYHML